MYSNSLHIVDSQIYAYLLIDRKTTEILDGNKLARSFYQTAGVYPELESLFQPNLENETLASVLHDLNTAKGSAMNHVKSIKASGEEFPCHIEICNVNDSLLFLIIKENCQMRDSKIKQLVELFDNPIFSLEHNSELTTTYGNARCYQYVRMEKHEFEQEHNASFVSILQEDKRVSFLQTLNQQIDEDGECDIDIEISLEDGFFQLFRFNAFKSTYDGKLYGVLISARKQSDLMKKIEYDQQFFDIMQQFSKDLLFRVDVDNRILIHRGDISKFVDLLPEMSGFPECMRNTRLVHPDDLEGYLAFIYRVMDGTAASFEPRFQFTDGSFEKYHLQASPLFNGEGKVISVIGKSENIQKYVDIETKAHYDALTTALNKQSFLELVTSKIERAVVSDKFALLFLDLDNFKGVNDTLGHVFGDFLLEATCKRIMNCIRSQDRLGRVGGDEFVVFFQFAPNQETVKERAEAILHSLRRDFTYGDQRSKVKASIGIALYPEHGTTYETLYDKADKALYQSKALGKDIATIYSSDLG
ncbi:MAG: sensor domain-containing diguanylate cyclase [Eubacteriales bacterium]